MADYTVSPCPVGHYCPEASEPYYCPAGQMRPTPGANSTETCPLCREGYYCMNDTANTMGIPCKETYACPEGTAIPYDCPAGFYCPPVTGLGIICPAGYYCPNATGSYPNLCNYPTYCPIGSNMTLLCPLGYKAVNHTGLRQRIGQSCSICPDGYYGNHTNRLTCSVCPPGFYCPEGTGDGKDNPCPVGFYCPEGTGTPVACPEGKYGKTTHAYSFEQCLACPAGTFNNKVTPRIYQF